MSSRIDPTRLSPAKRALLEQRLRAAPVSSMSPEIGRRPDRTSAPLSFIQRQMWVIDQMAPPPGNPAYNLPYGFRLRGPLDVAALEAGLNEIIKRHEALRTTFVVEDGEPEQRIHPELTCGIAVTSLEHLGPGEREARLDVLATEESVRPFDLGRLPLLRVSLFQLGAEEHVLLVNLHHIVADGLSIAVLLDELDALYRARTSGAVPQLRELPVQYGDFAAWQRGRVVDQVAPSHLKGTLPVLELPGDRSRPAFQSFAGSNVFFDIDPALTRELKRLGALEGCTAFMTLLSAFEVLLHRYAGADDLVIGTPVAARTPSEVEPLIGNFLTMAALRCDLSGDPSFREVLRRTRETTLDALSNTGVPLEAVMQRLKIERDPSRNPVFQVMFELLAVSTPRVGDLEVSSFHFDLGFSQLDLSLHLYEEGEGYVGRLEYCSAMFDRETVERLALSFGQLLRAITRDPDQTVSRIAVLAEEERRRLISEWNDTAMDYPSSLVPALIEAQVERAPQRVAIRCGAETRTYAELDARANRVAHALRSRGVSRGARVGLCVERGSDMLAALLGILKSGAAYVPLDPAFPVARLRFMADDARLACLVSTAALADACGVPREQQLLLDSDVDLLGGSIPVPVAAGATGEDPAYVIYTSGSTGKPKGVAVPHRAVVNFLTSMAREPGLAAADVLVAVTTLSFDIAVLELLLPLTVGATVVIATRDDAMDGQALRSLLEKHRATVMQATPVTWRLLLEAGWTPATPFRALVGGEALPQDLAQQLIDCGAELWNMYGPTETTVWSTCARISDASRITIGKPIANTTVRVLDARGELSPIGVPGELCIGGDGVALGYWNRPDLTAERFMPDPFGASPARLYRTGDRVRWRGDGALEHFGRFDDQVKVRGFRIELGEIESVIAGCPGVREVAVAARQDPPGEKRLVAYVVPANSPSLPDVAESIRARIRSVLPEYMVPTRFVTLDALPRTQNGKIDRKALPVPGGVAPRDAAVAPRTPTEAMVLGVFREVLGRDDFGAEGNFFDLGGDSLMAARMVLRLRVASGVDVPLRALFERQTVAGLAEAIDAQIRVGADAPADMLTPARRHRAIVPLQPRGTGIPIFGVPGHNGDVFAYRAFAQHLGPDLPFYGLQPPGLDGQGAPLTRIEDLAAYFAAQIRAFHPSGPCIVTGFCAGGMTAFELGRQLVQGGTPVSLVALFGAAYASAYRWRSAPGMRLEWLATHTRELRRLGWRERWAYVAAKLARRWAQRGLRRSPDPVLVLRSRVQKATIAAARHYTPERFAGRVCVVVPNREWVQSRYLPLSWGTIAREVDVYIGPDGCEQDNMLREPYAAAFAAYLARCVSPTPTELRAGGRRAEEGFIPQST